MPLTGKYDAKTGTSSFKAKGDKSNLAARGMAFSMKNALDDGMGGFTGEVKAKIARVGAAVDATSRTLPVEATLEGDGEGALPGMFVEVALSAAAPAQALLVPLDALVGKGAQRKVFVVGDDNKAQARDVVLLLVEGHLGRSVLERIARDARFDEEPGVGIAFQLDIEDAVGMGGQLPTVISEIEDEI